MTGGPQDGSTCSPNKGVKGEPSETMVICYGGVERTCGGVPVVVNKLRTSLHEFTRCSC